MTEKLERLIQTVRTRWVPEFQLQRYEDCPWTPMRTPLKESKGVLIGTGGIYVKGETPFTDHYGLGDESQMLPMFKALNELDEALLLDPDNFLIRKQRWYLRFPEKFHQALILNGNNSNWKKSVLKKKGNVVRKVV
jgi:hypothetical protein